MRRLQVPDKLEFLGPTGHGLHWQLAVARIVVSLRRLDSLAVDLIIRPGDLGSDESHTSQLKVLGFDEEERNQAEK